MDILTPASADTLFEAVNNQSAQMETLANQSLSAGIDKYVNKDYKGAVVALKPPSGSPPIPVIPWTPPSIWP